MVMVLMMQRARVPHTVVERARVVNHRLQILFYKLHTISGDISKEILKEQIQLFKDSQLQIELLRINKTLLWKI